MQGFYGKLPSLGDFVTRDLPRGFLDGWDDWLQRSIAHSKNELGDSWLNIYLHCPIWRFVLMPGVCGDRGWAGILMPSVDKVGRYFPLTIASTLGEDAKPFEIMTAAAGWFESAETLALAVLDQDRVDADELAVSVDALDNNALSKPSGNLSSVEGGEWGLRLSGLSEQSFPAAVCHELVNFQVGTYSVWWTSGAEDLASMGLIAPGLPATQSFSRLIAGSWEDTHEPGSIDDLTVDDLLAEEPI